MAPFRDLINDVLNIETELTDEVLSARLEYLHQLSLSEAEIESLANLLRRTSTPNQPGAEFIWHALERVFAGLSADSPTIIVLEDIHHLAKYELNRLAAMMHRSIEAHPLMFILTRRDVDDFPSLDFGVQVTLGSFGLEEQRRLIANLLEVETISDEIMDLVARTCEGNPLYLEEMIKYLLKEKQIRCADGAATLQTTGNRSLLPDSLASLLAARIDALDKASKGVLQLCSTIGHTFSTLLLREAMGIDDVIPLVTRLSQHGLIQQSSGESSEQWSFTSELVRAAAQRGILGIQRREYHLLIANAIESLYSENLDSWAEALANHYAEGGRLVDAARFAHRAAVRFEEQQFLDRARVLFQRGLKWINRVPRDPDNWDAKVQGEATFNYRLGALAVLLGDHTTAERYLQVALDISGDCGLSWIEARAHLKIGRICMQNGKLMLAEAHVDQARSLAQISRDPEMIMEALEAAANLAYDRGENQSSEALWTEALALASDDEAAQARCLLGMSNCHIRGGTYQDAEVLLDKALSMARSTGDRILIGRVLNNMGLLHFWGDQHTDALEAFREALRVRQGIGYTAGVVINHHNIGDVYFSTQDWARAWVAFERSRELAKEMGWTRGMILNDVYLGYIDARRGSWSEGLNRITMATKDALDMGDGEIATNGLFLAGRLYLENNMLEQARTELTEAKAQAERFGIRAMQEHVNTLLRQVRDQQASTQSEEE